MDITFESEFSNLQSDMISICLEYCKNECDYIYIYIAMFSDTISSDFFFSIDNELRNKSRLNGIDTISPLRQKEALKIVSNNAKTIISLCEKYNRPIPSEIKIVYDAKSNGAKCNYRYDNLSNENARELTEKWFNAIKIGNEDTDNA